MDLAFFVARPDHTVCLQVLVIIKGQTFVVVYMKKLGPHLCTKKSGSCNLGPPFVKTSKQMFFALNCAKLKHEFDINSDE